MKRGRVGALAAVVALAVGAVLLVVAALVPWYESRPDPVPVVPATVVPRLTGPPFASTSAAR